LVERGLVVRERDHEDWRVVLCRLTDTGERLIGSQWVPTFFEIRSRMEGLSYRQLLNLRRAMKAMEDAFKAIGKDAQPRGNSLVNEPVPH